MPDDDKPQPSTWRASLRWDLVAVALLAIASWGWAGTGHDARDISLWDEANYLHEGTQLPQVGLSTPEYAPLYQCWYYLLSLLSDDPMVISRLNYISIVTLVIASVYVLMRGLGVGLLPAFVTAFALQLTNIFVAWPWVALFALAMVLLLTTASFAIATLTGRLLFLACGFFVASYIRPEYSLSCLLLLVASAVSFAIQARSNRRLVLVSLLWSIPLAVIGQDLLLLAGHPFEDRTNRKLVAFGQHFGHEWILRTGANRNPWFEFEEILEEQFGPVDGVLDCLIANPVEFITHVIHNVPYLAGNTISLLHPDAALSRAAMVGLAAVLLLAFAGAIWWTRKTPRVASESSSGHWGAAIAMAAGVLTPTMISALLLYPRPHYLAPALVVVTSLGAAAVLGYRRVSLPKGLQLGTLVVLAASVYLVHPTRNPLWEPMPSDAINSLPTKSRVHIHREIVALLRRFELVGPEHPVSLLDAEGGLALVAGEHFHWINPLHKADDFADLLNERRMNMVLISPSLTERSRFAGDATFQEFANDPSAFGFAEISIPHSHWSLAVETAHLWATRSNRQFHFGGPGDRPVAGDWNGDGKDEVGVFRAGSFTLDQDADASFSSERDRQLGIGSDAHQPVPGDWNGDGTEDVGLFLDGIFSLDVNGDGIFDPAVDEELAFGLADDFPVSGDWNGDGVDDVGVFRDGVFHLLCRGKDSRPRSVIFGAKGDRPFVGDWNGDGRHDLGVLRGHRIILDANGDGVFEFERDAVVSTGFPEGIPVAGDWSGLGRDQLGVFVNGWFSLIEDPQLFGPGWETAPRLRELPARFASDDVEPLR
ncbi:hypothetical protein Pan216_57760 [Planctomycetes bacterium Pan216]|uniref:Uncharacterized protein n=2 Tax=Kolteria novifilia TaxID=2527975 RepID=A0A518BD95_9BACT|nr:hypothetical protein Pan216_57760 [Planctomycetes bacterium Pan216]